MSIPLADFIAPVVGRRGIGASYVFPFGLCEQTAGLARHRGELRHILLGVVPTDIDDRP
jgi:hypothetical protein